MHVRHFEMCEHDNNVLRHSNMIFRGQYDIEIALELIFRKYGTSDVDNLASMTSHFGTLFLSHPASFYFVRPVAGIPGIVFHVISIPH